MSSQLGEAFVPIRATLDKLDKDLAKGRDKLESTLGGMVSKAAGFGLKIGKAVAIGTAALGVGAASLTGVLLNAGSDVAEMQSKFNTVFAEEADGARSKLDEMAATIGRNRFELQGYASTLQDTLVPLGLSRSEAAKFSVDLVGLATDLSSFNNMPMDEALQRLQGTLIGSHENALAFGVVINENTLKAELAANGWDELTGAQLEAAKVQARINLLMKGTSDAQGDATKTAGGWANQMRRLVSIITETRDEIGLKLLPVFEPLLVKFNDFAAWVAPKVIDAFDLIVPHIQTFTDNVTGIGQQIIASFQAGGIKQVLFDAFNIGPDSPVFAFFDQLSTQAGTVFAQVSQYVGSAWTTLQMWAAWLVAEGGPAVLEFVRPIIEKSIPVFQEMIRIVREQILPVLGQFGAWLITEGVPRLAEFIAPIIQQIIPGLDQLRLWVVQLAAIALPLLAQAIQFVITNINIIAPILVAVGAVILALNAPITLIVAAIVGLASAWANNWFGIREKTAAVIEFLRPLFEGLGQLLSKFFQYLLPQLKQVWTTLVQVWQTQVGPALADLMAAIRGLMTDLGLAGDGTTAFSFVLTTLEIGLGLVFIAINLVIAIIKGWATVLTATVRSVENVIQTIRFFRDRIVDMYTNIKSAIDFIKELAQTLWRAIPDAINRAIRYVNDFIRSLAEIVVPDFLIPGSPTPFELGLRGIGKAANEAGRSMAHAFNRLPDMSSKFGGMDMMMQSATALAGAGGEMGPAGQQVSKAWNLTINSPQPPDINQKFEMLKAMEG